LSKNERWIVSFIGRQAAMADCRNTKRAAVAGDLWPQDTLNTPNYCSDEQDIRPSTGHVSHSHDVTSVAPCSSLWMTTH